ncbi:hypothetical protein SK128_009976 [Halocaridina rubra]|uniref:Uncharacterized protein n=1 Tax=Halocaridina rubra TaxID=373956 RepID=A0AAN9AHM9_HALRR
MYGLNQVTCGERQPSNQYKSPITCGRLTTGKDSGHEKFANTRNLTQRVVPLPISRGRLAPRASWVRAPNYQRSKSPLFDLQCQLK